MIRPPRTVAIDLTDRAAFPWLLGVVLAIPGLVLMDEASGTQVRVLEDGHLELVQPGGRPGGICAHSTAATRRAP